MNDVASLVRIFNPNPDDDYVDKRVSAISAIATKFKEAAVPSKFWKYSNDIAEALATGTMPVDLAEIIEASIKSFSSSFTRADNDLQMLVCALAGAYEVVSECSPSDNGYTSSEIFTCALLSALSGPLAGQTVALEKCRTSLIDAANTIVDEAAQRQRERKKVPDFAISLDTGDVGNDLAVKLKTSLEKLFQPLRKNAVLDREELELLWWAVGDWSEIARSQMSSLAPAIAVLLSSFETANRLRRIPASAHVAVALTKVSANVPVNFDDLRAAAQAYKEKFEEYDGKFLQALNYPWAFPLLHALFTSDDQSPFKNQESPPREWARRLMIEIGIVRITDNHVV